MKQISRKKITSLPQLKESSRAGTRLCLQTCIRLMNTTPKNSNPNNKSRKKKTTLIVIFPSRVNIKRMCLRRRRISNFRCSQMRNKKKSFLRRKVNRLHDHPLSSNKSIAGQKSNRKGMLSTKSRRSTPMLNPLTPHLEHGMLGTINLTPLTILTPRSLKTKTIRNTTRFKTASSQMVRCRGAKENSRCLISPTMILNKRKKITSLTEKPLSRSPSPKVSSLTLKALGASEPRKRRLKIISWSILIKLIPESRKMRKSKIWIIFSCNRFGFSHVTGTCSKTNFLATSRLFNSQKTKLSWWETAEKLFISFSLAKCKT